MSGKKPQLSPLESRKSLLIAESELNRTELVVDWQMMSDGVRMIAARVKSVSALASAAALLGAGLSAFGRGRTFTHGAKSSWLQRSLKGARLAASLWLAFRARPR